MTIEASASLNFLKAHNARHVWHPMGDPKHSEADPPLIIAGGEGSFVFDADGKKYLDCVAGLWNVNVGHGRPELKAAIVEQLDKLAYYATFMGTSNPPSIALSALLMEMLAPEGMSKVMFSSGGSDANETAFKIARQYWKIEGQPERSKIISMKLGYHGVHFGGMSATGTGAHRRVYEPLVPGFFHIECPYLYRNPWTNDHDELGRNCAAELDRMIAFQGPDTVAAFIAEPVQGAGGVIVPPANFWPLVRAVCDKHGVLLIADEVVTGFGRSGSMFGSRGWGVKPDIMSLAKGINSGYVPLGATVVNERIATAWQKPHPMAGIFHGYTYSGHPLACAAALANLKIVQDENLPENAGKVGAYFMDKLRGLMDRHEVIGDVRGKGLMIGVELVKNRKSKEPFLPPDPIHAKLTHGARARGAVIRVNAGKIIISPPLIFTKANADAAVAMFDDLLTECVKG
jgi:putrescine---pyruvate transaminase